MKMRYRFGPGRVVCSCCQFAPPLYSVPLAFAVFVARSSVPAGGSRPAVFWRLPRGKSWFGERDKEGQTHVMACTRLEVRDSQDKTRGRRQDKTRGRRHTHTHTLSLSLSVCLSLSFLNAGRRVQRAASWLRFLQPRGLQPVWRPAQVTTPLPWVHCCLSEQPDSLLCGCVLVFGHCCWEQLFFGCLYVSLSWHCLLRAG